MAHKDVYIEFVIDGVGYKAVGFLKDGEEDPNRYTVRLRHAFERVDGVVESDEDWERIHRNHKQLPDELFQFHILWTKRPDVNLRGELDGNYSFLRQRTSCREWSSSWVGDEWQGDWYGPSCPCSTGDLILCRDS